VIREDALATAIERGQALLEAPHWVVRDRELTLLLVDPPRTDWATSDVALDYWLLVEAREAHSLPAPLGEHLARHGWHHDDALTVWTVEGLERLLEAATRHALEARWTVRHATAVHDPLARHPRLAAAASRLPADADERIARGLLGQLVTAIDDIEPERTGALVALGEAAGALARLACLLDGGSYPSPRWLLPAAAATDLGGRVASWFEALVPALAGEARAQRHVQDSAPNVLRAAIEALQPRFRDRDWLREPEAYALRPPAARRS
jgi:hypothetical protein